MDKIDRNYCFADNADFLPVELAGGMAVIRKKDDSSELRKCLNNTDHWLEDSEIMKDSRTTKAGIVKLTDDKEVFIKRFNNKSFAYTLKYIFRKARPFRVWSIAWALEKAGIPTPRPMAALAKYKYGIPGNSYLIRHVAPQIIPTLEFFDKFRDNPELRESYLEAVAAMFAKMHDAGIYHGDAKCSNIYVENCKNATFSYGVWDLLSCRIGLNSVSKALREKEISRIAWSFAEISNRNSDTVAEFEIKKQLNKLYQKNTKT